MFCFQAGEAIHLYYMPVMLAAGVIGNILSFLVMIQVGTTLVLLGLSQLTHLSLSLSPPPMYSLKDIYEYALWCWYKTLILGDDTGWHNFSFVPTTLLPSFLSSLSISPPRPPPPPPQPPMHAIKDLFCIIMLVITSFPCLSWHR